MIIRKAQHQEMASSVRCHGLKESARDRYRQLNACARGIFDVAPTNFQWELLQIVIKLESLFVRFCVYIGGLKIFLILHREIFSAHTK